MNARVYVLVLLVTTTHALRRDIFNNALRIYNGFDDDTLKYPYVVAIKPELDLHFYVQRICTGSLIHAKWVLSAAHCLTKAVKYIQFGNMSLPLNQTETKSRVIEMIQHPRVFPAAYANDIGLIRVAPVSMSKYASLSAVDYISLLGLPVEYAGFGMSYFPKRKINHKVKLNKMDILRPLQIAEAVVKSCSDPFSRNFICLSSKCSRTQLMMAGDSGSPLVCGEKIIGIACTFIVDQNEQIFTPISPYLTWIQKIVSSE